MVRWGGIPVQVVVVAVVDASCVERGGEIAHFGEGGKFWLLGGGVRECDW